MAGTGSYNFFELQFNNSVYMDYLTLLQIVHQTKVQNKPGMAPSQEG